MKRALLVGVSLMLSAGAVAAGDDDPPEPCFASVGCVDNRKISVREAESLSCDELWTVRNGLFAAHGYCFKGARGKAVFGNGTCSIADQSAVPLNDYERANISLIRKIEKRRGC